MGLRFKYTDKLPAEITGRVYGLFVGIEDYSDDVIPDLKYSKDDAEGLHAAFGGGDNEHLVLLLEKEASRSRILGNLSTMMRKSTAGDLLIFYVATHGVLAFNDFFFVPQDGNWENLLGTCISSKLLINALSSISDNGAKILLIFDTCHSGAIGFDISKSQSRNGGGISCLFSASPSELALESSAVGHGYFSYYMMEALSGEADVDGDGVITLRNMYDHVYSRTQRDSHKEQHPILIGTLPNQTALKVLR